MLRKKFKMKSKTIIFTLCVIICEYSVQALSYPGPRVYVVTPSTRILKKDGGKPTPFYYHNWMRRMDTASDTTTSTTTTTETSAPKVKTPDLIFAEFESDGSKQKSIRKLLEKERITPKKTTVTPIYVPDEEESEVTRVVNYGLPVKTISNNESFADNKYSYMQNEYYSNLPAPMYVTVPPTTTTKVTTTTLSPINVLENSHHNVQNVWNIIDSEKSDQYSNNWEEISLDPKNVEIANDERDNEKNHQQSSDSYKPEYDDTDVAIDDNFALPGFATNPGNGAENESRAIRTEQNIRFPYINLKPFQMKTSKKPVNNISNDKKNNLYTNLNNFYDLKKPVRGEAQDVVPNTPGIDRYNPAQPYLPQQKYGSNLSKQSSPPKATASLVPPPPPPPKITNNDFPAPISYESFPPYAPSAPDFGPAPAPAPPPMTPSKTPDITNDFDTSGPNPSDDSPMMDIGYRYKSPSDNSENDNVAPIVNTGYQYKPLSAPTPQFYPTPVPPSKPFNGYTYNKPSMNADAPMTAADKPDFQGYHYSKPVYHKPPADSMPPSYGSPPSYGHDDFPSDTYDHDDTPPQIFDHDDTPPHNDEESDSPHSHDSDEDMSDMQGYDMGMKPPPPTLQTDVKPGHYGPPPNDHGFPSDFPTDFKLPPDFDDHYHAHDHEHEHYHIVEPPTTTTETPRVNRFSYYYLGKKLYYLPLYFSVYFIIYVGALIIKAVLRHKIVYPNSWRPNTTTATFFSKRSVDEYLSHENLHGLTKKVTNAIALAAEKYMDRKNKLS